MSLIYLSGPITGLTYGDAQRTWRQEAKIILERHGHNTVSPLRCQDHRDADGVIGSDKLPPGPHTTPKGITLRDLWDTERSDVLFCNLLGAKRVSIGSVGELFRANVRRPQIIVLGMENSGNPNDHAMVRTVSAMVVPTFEKMIEVTLDLVGRGTSCAS